MPYKTMIPGLPGGPLETSFPIKIMTPPAWRTNVRPGIKARSPRLSIQHETANPNTMAVGDASYLFNGSGGRQASWHFTVDDREAYTGIPADEVGWQAGDGAGPGNYNGLACELAVKLEIVNDPQRRAQSQKNAAEILGKTGARVHAKPPAQQHANFMNKNCPAQMRNRGEWSRYVDWWNHFNAMERKAMAGDTTVPAYDGINIGDTIKAKVRLNVRQRATTRAPIVTTLEVGSEMVVNGRWESADGYRWLPVDAGGGDGFVAMGDADGAFIEKVERAPTPGVTYAKRRPVKALLDTDLKEYDTAEGITTDNEHDFIFVADVIEFTKPTVAGQYALAKPEPVKAPYRPGERAIAAWLVKNREDVWHYLLAGGGDEWVRVLYANTRRISDAPLLGDDME